MMRVSPSYFGPAGIAALAVFCGSSFGQVDRRPLLDEDGDGWDDLWMAIYRESIDISNPRADYNSDGVTV